MNRAWSSAMAMLATLAATTAQAARPADRGMEVKVVDEHAAGPGEARSLPYAQGRTFATLDDYLAFLRRRGASGVPWYREVSPGVFELVARRGPGAPPVRATRADLMERFGFVR